MKVAVPSAFPTVDACVAAELCCSQYLLIITLGTMEYEAMPNPLLAVSGPAAGELFARQLSQEGVSKVIVDTCSSKIRGSLGRVGIQVMDGMSGPITIAIKQFRKICMADTIIMPVEAVQCEKTKNISERSPAL